jgi:hypothetical protein
MPSEVQDIFGHTSHGTANRIYAHSWISFLRDAFDSFSASLNDLAPPRWKSERGHSCGSRAVAA